MSARYAADSITPGEIESVIRKLTAYSSADQYESNKAIMKLVADGFLLKREDRNQKDLQHMRIEANGDGVNPTGDGKGGTYFGATDCGKSYTMLFLTRLLMKSVSRRCNPNVVVPKVGMRSCLFRRTAPIPFRF